MFLRQKENDRTWKIKDGRRAKKIFKYECQSLALQVDILRMPDNIREYLHHLGLEKDFLTHKKAHNKGNDV